GLGHRADRRVALRARLPGLPWGKLGRLARASHHRVAVREKAVAEDLADLAGTENADLLHGGTLSRRAGRGDPERGRLGPDDRAVRVAAITYVAIAARLRRPERGWLPGRHARPDNAARAEDRPVQSRIMKAMPALAERDPSLVNASQDVAAPEVAEPEVVE